MPALSGLPISVTMSRPNASFSASRISAALSMSRRRSANVVRRCLRYAESAQASRDSSSLGVSGVKVRRVSPVAGLMVAMGMGES